MPPFRSHTCAMTLIKLTLSLPHAELLKPEFFGRLTTYPVTCKLQHAGLFVTYAGPRSAYWESR